MKSLMIYFLEVTIEENLSIFLYLHFADYEKKACLEGGSTMLIDSLSFKEGTLLKTICA